MWRTLSVGRHGMCRLYNKLATKLFDFVIPMIVCFGLGWPLPFFSFRVCPIFSALAVYGNGSQR